MKRLIFGLDCLLLIATTILIRSNVAFAGNSIGTGPAKSVQDQFFWELDNMDSTDAVNMADLMGFKYAPGDHNLTIPQESLSQIDALMKTVDPSSLIYNKSNGWVIRNQDLTVMIKPVSEPATDVNVRVFNYNEGLQVSFPDMKWDEVKTFAPGITGLIEGR